MFHLVPNPEPYRETVSLTGGNNSASRCGRYDRRNGAVLDGSKPVPGREWHPVRPDVYRFPLPRGGYHRLFLDGKPAVRVTIDPPRATSRTAAAALVLACRLHLLPHGKRQAAPRIRAQLRRLPVGISLYQ